MFDKAGKKFDAVVIAIVNHFSINMLAVLSTRKG